MTEREKKDAMYDVETALEINWYRRRRIHELTTTAEKHALRAIYLSNCIRATEYARKHR